MVILVTLIVGGIVIFITTALFSNMAAVHRTTIISGHTREYCLFATFLSMYTLRKSIHHSCVKIFQCHLRSKMETDRIG